jgi:RNA polymerase-interacting CarD/CdnL/TRCF family regulator
VKGPPARHEEPQEVWPAVEGVIADAKDLKPGDRVVYPNQGVCRVTGTESKEIAGQRLELVRMEREEDGAAVLVPKPKVPTVGLRKVASRSQIEGVFHYLAASFDDPELDWKVRHRDNADRLIAGGVLGVAEVVKGLHSLSRIRPLPAKEREQYDNARHLLVHEVAVSLAVPPALAEDYVDFALMPPEGVKFDLKPPPRPVTLPVRPRRRIVKPAASEDELGLDDLGIELGEEGEVDLGAAPAIPGVELPAVPEGDLPAGDDEAAEGEEETLAPAAEDEADADEELPVPAAARGKGAKAEKAPRPAKPAAAAPKKAERKAPERAARKPEKKAEKPAAKKAAAKPEKKAEKPAAKKPARAEKPPARKPEKKVEKPAARKAAPTKGRRK